MTKYVYFARNGDLVKIGFSCVLLLMCVSSVQAQPHWYSSKRFWVMFAADAGAMNADYYASQRCFRAGGYETNPIRIIYFTKDRRGCIDEP